MMMMEVIGGKLFVAVVVLNQMMDHLSLRRGA